ncbi:MAG: hypothetical protein ACFE78_01760 [Candidatus Hodarchaeota archaeon]
MQNNEFLAQEALKYLEIAQRFEAEGKSQEAIENYQLAAENLKKSGYMMHRISELYDRIEALKSYMKEQRLYQHEKISAQIEKFQDQAFIIIDRASELESTGSFQDAIERYNSAIKLLNQAGWSESQLQNLKMKVAALADKDETQKTSKSDEDISILPSQIGGKPQVVDAFGEKKSMEKAEQLRKYQEMKAKQEKVQNEAFAFIDNAKFYEKNKKFNEAIENYEKAVDLLNSIGWKDQTQNIQFIIEKLIREKETHERFETKQQIEQSFIGREIDSQVDSSKIVEFEFKKRSEEDIQIEAFNLIDFAKKLEREKEYTKAIEKFQKAIELFESIEWDSYIQPIVNFIDGIKEKQSKEDQLEEIRKKREDNLEKIQDRLFLKEKEHIIQTAKDFDIKHREYVQKRQSQLEKESQFFAFLDKADNKLQQNQDFNGAIKEYHNALEILLDLGSGWESYIPTIKTTIESVKKLKEAQYEKEFEAQKRLEEKSQQELEFQKQISTLLEKERKKLKEKEIEIQLEKDKQGYIEQRKDTAFKTLDDAQKYIKMGDLDNAILAYQNAGNIFTSIQWQEEVPLIEASIKELENMKNEIEIKKQKDIQSEIERQKEEEEFQLRISTQLRSEREKLRKKEIKLRERDKELEYRQKRKEDAFKILDQAQIYINDANFDKAIEYYHIVANIFAEIQWYDEVEFIGNAIIEIENQRRDLLLKRQRELQRKLDREKKEKEFQINILGQLKLQKEKFKQNALELRDKDKELEYREHKRSEAFNLIEEAQNYLSLGRFNEAIETYRNVANIFAQIQWKEEIPIIHNAITEIETKRRKKELLKQKRIEESVKKELEDLKFFNRIKRQREFEIRKMQKEQEMLAKKEELSAQQLSKQEQAFKLIDNGDFLLHQERFEDAITTYQQALNLLNSIGWKGGYVKLIQETIDEINFKKEEEEKAKIREKELARKQAEEERKFEMKLTEQMQRERERFMRKKIEIKKKEVIMEQMKSLKIEAFDLMDKAESLLNIGLYEQAIELYQQAELVLNEIQYPTDAIKELILNIQEKKREKDLAKQHDLEQKIRKEEEEKIFQQKIVENVNFEKERIKNKQIELRKREIIKEYMNKRKEDAFDLLDQAESFLKAGLYDKALEFYHSAELILNEIQFPTESVRETILKVTDKKREQELKKQKELEVRLQKEKEQQKFNKRLSEQISREKARLKEKKIKIQEIEKVKAKVEAKKEEAFGILEDAENFIKTKEYDKAISNYRQVMLLLNEIQFPTDSITEMIDKAENLKKQKFAQQQAKLERELAKIEEEKKLRNLIEERRKLEKEKQLAQRMALQERERLVQEQLSHREAAYSLLEKAGNYLMRKMPDYDNAISLYIQARNILAEKVGWEPEINSINTLIEDLEREKKNLIEKKKREEKIRIERQREYEKFQEVIRQRREDYLRRKRDQQKKMIQLKHQQQYADQIKDVGLKLIDEGKRLAIHHDFEKAYNHFEQAIAKFNEIGWDEQTKFIEKEIENTKLLQEKVKEEERRIKKIYEELVSKKRLEEIRLKEKEIKIKETIGELSDMTDGVSHLIKQQIKEQKLKQKEEKEREKKAAKKFRQDMKELIKLKQELINEIKRSKEDAAIKREEMQLSKDKEKADEIKEMLKDLTKKEKN